MIWKVELEEHELNRLISACGYRLFQATLAAELSIVQLHCG